MRPIRLTDERAAQAAIHQIKGATGRHPFRVMTIQSEDALRNNEQNALFHAIIGQMSDQSTHWGDGKYISPTVMKEWVVSMYLPHKTISLPNGTQVVKRQSTTKLSRRQFADLIKHTLAMAVDMDMTIEFKGDKARRFHEGDSRWWE